MIKDTLTKFLQNRCNKEELQNVIRWVKTEESTKAGEDWGWENWQATEDVKSGSDEKFSLLFDKIQNTIDCNRFKKGTSRITLYAKWLSRVAAVILLPLLTVFLLHVSKFDLQELEVVNRTDTLEVVSPIGARTVVYLSDGSVAHLNYGSRLKYPGQFRGARREVQLIGEGFFEVAHNPKKPFIVQTKELNIKAVGTSFNVCAYPENDIIETTLAKGKVILEQRIENNELINIGSMVPNQYVVFNKKTKQIKSIIGEIKKYISWKDGILIFEDTSMKDVSSKLSKMFNVDIEIEDEVLDYVYTVTLQDEPLYQILDLMAIATPIDYKIVSRKKQADGSYTKQKIIIRKSKNKTSK